jgi:RNA polymerase sigma-70 factor (ECF subfamily)
MRTPNTPGKATRGLDGRAFLRLYDAEAESLLRYFARRVLDPQAAADLTGETFAEAFGSRLTFRPERGSAGAWLQGIARRRLARYSESLRLETAARERLGIDTGPLDPDDLDRIERLVDFEQAGRLLGQALRDLAGDQREAVVLRVVDGLSYPQIAERQRCSEPAARARVSRGLRALAASIGPELDRGEA